MEPNRNDRWGLSDVILGYSPRRRNQEKMSHDTEQKDQKRKYTCAHCKRTCASPIWKNSHVEKNPDFQQDPPQKENFENKCQDCNRTFRIPAELRHHRQYICAELKQAEPTQNNIIGTSEEDEARQQERRKESETGTATAETERRVLSRKMTSRKEEGAEAAPGNHLHQRGRPIQPGESRENIKRTLHYNAATETWQCAQCKKQYAEKEAIGAATHVADRTGENRRRMLQQELHSLEENSHLDTDATRIRTLLQYGNAKRGILEKPTEYLQEQEPTPPKPKGNSKTPRTTN